MTEFLTELRRTSGVPAHVGATAPVEGREDDRRHPDAQLFVSPAQLKVLETAIRPAPVPDVVVEIDTTLLGWERFEARLDAYRRLGVAELWVWSRTGGSEAQPQGAATIFVAVQDGWREIDESAAAPGLRPGDLEALLQEPNDIARTRRAEELAVRLAPAFTLQYGP